MALALETLPEALEPATAARASGAAAAPSPAGRMRRRWLRRRIPDRDITFFYTQVTLLLETGSPLAPGLRQMAAQGASPRLVQVVTSIVEELEGGNTFARSLLSHPDVFSPMEISMIQVGETGGIMADMLNRVVALRQRRERLHAAVRGAVAYPSVLLVVATAVVIFMLTFVFPRFAQVFADMRTSLPLSTRILIGASSLVRTRWYLLLGGGFLGAIVLRRWFRSTGGARAKERALTSFPWVGELLDQIALSQLFLNLGFLLQAKVPLLAALTVCRDSMARLSYRELVDTLVAAAERGEGLAGPLARSPLMPGLVKSIVATGEETGRTDQVFLRLAGYYDEQVEKKVKTLPIVLEPILLVVMGLVVGFVVISLILPIFRMSRGVT